MKRINTTIEIPMDKVTDVLKANFPELQDESGTNTIVRFFVGNSNTTAPQNVIFYLTDKSSYDADQTTLPQIGNPGNTGNTGYSVDPNYPGNAGNPGNYSNYPRDNFPGDASNSGYASIGPGNIGNLNYAGNPNFAVNGGLTSYPASGDPRDPSYPGYPRNAAFLRNHDRGYHDNMGYHGGQPGNGGYGHNARYGHDANNGAWIGNTGYAVRPQSNTGYPAGQFTQ